MARSAAVWSKVECDGADVEFCQHWGGLLEIVCGQSRVMVCYCGLERLTKLPQESVARVLIEVLKAARVERRNCEQAVLLSAVLERKIASAIVQIGH